MNKVYTHEDLERKNYLLAFKSKEEIVDMLLSLKNANRLYRSMIVRYSKTLKEIRDYIKGNEDFYYGDELYESYEKILEIIEKGLKEGSDTNEM